MKCTKHPNYKAIRAPRSKIPGCTCRKIWEAKQAKLDKEKPKRGGRPKGTKEFLPRGSRKLIEEINRAIKELGEDDPIVQAAYSKLCDVLIGNSRHRYVGFELQAARELLDRRRGKATENVKGDHTVTVVVREEEEDA